MKQRTVIAVVALILSGGVVFCLRARARPVSITFVRYDGAESQTAVFCVTNSSVRPFTFVGSGPSEPRILYRIPEGAAWKVMERTDAPTHNRLYTLAPKSSIEFRVPSPTSTNTAPASHFTESGMPAVSGTGEFAVTLALYPGDATAVAMRINSNYRSPRERVADVLLEPARMVFEAGWIDHTKYTGYQQFVKWAMPFSGWHSSSPAHH